MKNYIILAFVLLPSLFIKAQSIETDTTSNNLRISSLPYNNYGQGLGITAADSLFQLNLRFRMQNRVSYFALENS